jgi:hypothetical protein
MATNTLPPGWTGNDADHHVTAGSFKIHVTRAATYNPFTRRNERTGGYTWRVCPAYGPPLASSSTIGKPTAAEARKEALTAVRVLVGGVVEMLDWLDANPVAVPTEP